MERPVTASPARQQRAECAGRDIQELLGHTGRRRRAHRIPVAAHVLGRDPALLAHHAHADRPTVGHQCLEPLVRRTTARARVGPAHACGDILGGEVAEPAQQVVDLVR